jgi:8-amino-7-oxononanoate synthase
MSLRDRWTAELDELRSRGRLRCIASSGGVDFCSNDYLGYAATGWKLRTGTSGDPIAQLRSASAARLLRGHHAVWEQVESRLAAWHGAAAALVMSSGYAANEGLLSTIIGSDDWVASDQLNHASIIDGLRLSRAERFVYGHSDLNQLADGLGWAARHRGPDRELFIVTESLFGMDGDIAPLRELAALAERFDAHLVVDEAHATGCYGGRGSGLVDALDLRGHVTATVHTGGKALAVCGAYICCCSALRELLLNRCRQFMFSTALPPAIGLWWNDALDRVQPDTASRTGLHATARRFRGELLRHGVAPPGSEYVVPVVIGDDSRAARAAARLQARGWDIRAIRPPTVPEGTARLRVSIHANHPPDLVDEVAASLADVLKDLAHD